MDLVESAAALHQPQNRLYESKFLGDLLKRFRRKVELYPVLYSGDGLNNIHTMRQFDEQVVARYGGFTGADDYYQSVASSNWAQDIIVPTLILHALDDPFIRMTPETRGKLLANSRVRLVETRHGSHEHNGNRDQTEITNTEACVLFTALSNRYRTQSRKTNSAAQISSETRVAKGPRLRTEGFLIFVTTLYS
jgi:pimeloyl-ACP methyl ester carboxylesterase